MVEKLILNPLNIGRLGRGNEIRWASGRFGEACGIVGEWSNVKSSPIAYFCLRHNIFGSRPV